MMKFTSYIAFFFAFILCFSFSAGAQKMLDQSYYEDGSLKSTEYQFGPEYQRVDYHKNGLIKEKFNLSNNERNGKFATWNEEGKKMSEVEYKNNVPDGIWVIRDSEGRVIASAEFENGKIKTASIWDESGNLIAHR